MSQILLILNDKVLSTSLHGKLSQKYEAEVIVKGSANEAISLLDILDVDIILCNDVNGRLQVAKKICDYLNTKKESDEDTREIAVVVIGKSTPKYSKVFCVGENPNYQKLISYMGFLLGKEEENVFLADENEGETENIETEVVSDDEVESEKEPEKEIENDDEKTTVFRLPSNLKSSAPPAQEQEQVIDTTEYFPINAIYFMNLAEVVFDFSVYSRIKKTVGFEYIKKFNANSKVTYTEIERVLLRSGKDLYVVVEDSIRANALLNKLFLERFKTPNMSWIERTKVNSDSFEILLDLFKNSAFDKYNVEIIKEIIKSMDMMVKAPDGMAYFLAGLNEQKASYGYTHAHLTLYLLLQIVDNFSWGKDQSKNKLLYLSLFHDLNLSSDRLIRLHHNYSQESKNLTDEEKQIMLGHAEASARVLESIVKAPKELATLIKEHHGLKSGKGFIDSLSIVISPTSMAFIVVEAFVTHYLSALEKMEGNKAGGLTPVQLEPIFKEMKTKYDKLTYAEVLAELQKYMEI